MRRLPSSSPVFANAWPNALLAGAIALLLFTLTGCSQEDEDSSASATSADTTDVSSEPAPAPAPPTISATLKRSELMALVFRGWQDGQPPNQPDIVQLPEIGSDGNPVAGSEAEQKAQVTPREVVRLDDTHAVMLTEAVPLDEQGQPMNGHVSGAWLGAYFFEQGPDGWALTKRSDAVDYLGFSGNMGDTQVERIAPQRFVLTVTNGSCWQGYCGRWLAVYELGAGEVRELMDSVPLAGSNIGADEACEQVLDGKTPETPPRGECFDVSGTPEFALGTDDDPGGMRIVFGGKRAAGARAGLQTVDSTTVYAYRRKAYVLTEGRNPVPSF